MNTIEIFNETSEKIPELETVKALLEYAVTVEEKDYLEFSVIIVDRAKIHEINYQYRGIDRETDVISFALEDDTCFPKVEGTPVVLGDIYISIEKAKEQALQYGHSLLRELCFLALHGFLHLLGYDHMQKEDEKVMFARQELILNGYGITR